jgi:hypothetical protein
MSLRYAYLRTLGFPPMNFQICPLNSSTDLVARTYEPKASLHGTRGNPWLLRIALTPEPEASRHWRSE